MFAENVAIEKRQTDANTVDGATPPYVEILRGRDGRDGRDGEPGPRGLGKNGERGEKGDTGAQGSPGSRSGGVTYIRWGRTTCPDTEGTELVSLEEPQEATIRILVVAVTTSASQKSQKISILVQELLTFHLYTELSMKCMVTYRLQAFLLMMTMSLV